MDCRRWYGLCIPDPAPDSAAPDAPLICNLCMSSALRLRPLSSGFLQKAKSERGMGQVVT